MIASSLCADNGVACTQPRRIRPCGAAYCVQLPLANPLKLLTLDNFRQGFEFESFKEYSVAPFLNAPGSEVIGTVMIQVSEQGGMGPVAALTVVQLVIIAVVTWRSRFVPQAAVRD